MMDLAPLEVQTFDELRREYLESIVANELIHKSIKKLIIRQVNALEDREYKIVGYGSLLNASDVYRTSPNMISHEVGYLDGWKRIFNMGSTNTGSYLNVVRDNTLGMIVSILTVPAEDMFNIIEREINYDMLDVEVRDAVGDPHNAKMVIGRSGTTKFNLIPQANYLHLCMTGVGNLAGQGGIDNFIETTDTCFGSLKEFLQTPLETIYRKQIYSPR